LFVLVHRFRQKARIYASSSKVNSPAAPAVARIRQPWLPQDLCNNAIVFPRPVQRALDISYYPVSVIDYFARLLMAASSSPNQYSISL